MEIEELFDLFDTVVRVEEADRDNERETEEGAGNLPSGTDGIVVPLNGRKQECGDEESGA
jgi:hypothetical protein